MVVLLRKPRVAEQAICAKGPLLLIATGRAISATEITPCRWVHDGRHGFGFEGVRGVWRARDRPGCGRAGESTLGQAADVDLPLQPPLVPCIMQDVQVSGE